MFRKLIDNKNEEEKPNSLDRLIAMICEILLERHGNNKKTKKTGVCEAVMFVMLNICNSSFFRVCVIVLFLFFFSILNYHLPRVNGKGREEKST